MEYGTDYKHENNYFKLALGAIAFIIMFPIWKIQIWLSSHRKN
jgi:hypothetical protein